MSQDRAKQGTIYVKHRDIVLPGDLIAVGSISVEKYPYAYCVEGKCFSTVIGVAEERGENQLRIVPLEGFYNPKEEDIVIGVVEEVGISSVILDIRAPYKGVLPASEIAGKQYSPAQEPLINLVSPGDIYLAKVERFDLTRDPLLTIKGKDLGRVLDGILIEIVPTRIPRIIGKKRSMLEMLIKETQCQVVPTANGRILIRGCPSSEHEAIAVNSIKMIENSPYIQGLTEKIREYLVIEKVRRGLVKGEG